MTIDRFANSFLEPDQISAGPPGAGPITGTVTPSFPFAGSATYSQPPGSPATWSGDLRAWLPGAGYVPLTGPGFSQVLCGGKQDSSELEGCQEEAERLLRASTLI